MQAKIIPPPTHPPFFFNGHFHIYIQVNVTHKTDTTLN